MNRVVIASISIVAALVVAFVATPAAKVSPQGIKSAAVYREVAGPNPALVNYKNPFTEWLKDPKQKAAAEAQDEKIREDAAKQISHMELVSKETYYEKSGLRMAIEGRLHWLGLI